MIIEDQLDRGAGRISGVTVMAATVVAAAFVPASRRAGSDRKTISAYSVDDRQSSNGAPRWFGMRLMPK
jgi:hypothetical protein